MKRWVRMILPIAMCIVLLQPGMASASADTTDVEQKWIDFQKAVMDRMVKEGRLTASEAETRLNEFRTRFAESEGDSIYEFFSDKSRIGNESGGKCKDGQCKGTDRDDAAFRVYSMITGKTVDELKKTCEKGNLTIWKLAEKEGKLQALKEKLMNGHAAGLDELVKSGVLNEQQRQKIMGRIQAELEKK